MAFTVERTMVFLAADSLLTGSITQAVYTDRKQ